MHWFTLIKHFIKIKYAKEIDTEIKTESRKKFRLEKIKLRRFYSYIQHMDMFEYEWATILIKNLKRCSTSKGIFLKKCFFMVIIKLFSKIIIKTLQAHTSFSLDRNFRWFSSWCIQAWWRWKTCISYSNEIIYLSDKWQKTKSSNFCPLLISILTSFLSNHV